MPKLPKISVVISAYNDQGLLETLLKKLFKTRYKNFEVVVVDDASQQDLTKLKELYPIRYFRNKKNLGSAETKNIAARKARGQILLSLDNDVCPLGDLIWEVHRFFQKNPKAIAVTGFPGTEMENPTFFRKYKYLRDWSYWHLERDPSSFYYFRPAIGAIRRDVFLRLGGYSNSFCQPGTAAVEDLEFSYRLAAVGKVLFNPKLIVGHPFGGISKLIKTYFERSALFSEILKENRQFSGVTTTKGEALTIALAVLSLLLLPASRISQPAVWVFLVLFLAFIFRQRKFLGLCLEREGPAFTLGALLTNWLLYLVIFCGAGWALFNLILAFTKKACLRGKDSNPNQLNFKS